MSLRLDWCSHEAAKYAVEHWHYSRSLPASKLVKIGVWEDDVFIGAVIFSRGANQYLGLEFGLKANLECAELTRVALNKHQTPVSRILSIALKMFRKQSPGVRLIVSYADCDEDHHGGIYAANGWIYLGRVQTGGGTPKFKINGRVVHGRSIGSRYGRGAQNLAWLRKHVDPRAEAVYTLGKHKYVYLLDREMRERLAPFSKPYPKRAVSRDGAATVNQTGEGGSIPTTALQIPENM